MRSISIVCLFFCLSNTGRHFADEPGKELEQLWTDLGSVDYAAASRAFRELAAASDAAVPFLERRIREVAVPTVDLKRLQQFTHNLDDKEFAVRQEAADEIVKYGELAVRPLQELIEKNSTLEASRRAGKLLESVKVPAITPDRMRAFDGIAILETLGSPAAHKALVQLQRDALIPMFRNEAARALQRLKRK